VVAVDVVPAAAAFVVAVVFVAETDAAAASEDEFGDVETVVQLKECAWNDYYWDITAVPLQKKQSSS
jgi:hypothetical protein